MGMENYETVCNLGSGACGTVSLVRNRKTKMLCALKKIQLDEFRQCRTKAAVMKEASILAKLKHPHIVSYHESFFDEDEKFLNIVQDYCDGGTLEDKINEARSKKKNIAEEQIMRWFIQVVMAAQHMHSKKILHRDLKSQNVFLTKKGVVKLGDFGISKALDTTIDSTGTVVGTPCYLSPELCQDIPYSSKADVWAIGCLLYEMCALQPAFDAQNLMSLFMKIAKGDFQPLPEHVSEPLKDLVKYIMNKSPEDRPSASSILNHPIVQQHLAIFIEEKEYLLKQKETQQKLSPLCSKRASGKSETESNASPSASASNKSDVSVDTSDSGVGMYKLPKDQREEREEDITGEASDYSDDFDSSDDEEGIIEPIDEAAETEPSGEAETYHCEEYADDFEEDDSFAEDLDEIVNQAKEAQGLIVEDDYIVDEDSEYSLKQKLYDVLGEKKFEQMRQIICSDISEDSRFSVRRTAGEDNVEVCYLTCEEDKEDFG